VHSRALEASTDGNFTARLHHTSGSAKTLSMKFSIAHALLILFDVVDTFAGRLATGGVAPQSAEERWQAAIVEFLTPLAGRGLGLLVVRPVDGFGDITQVFLHVITIDDLQSIGKQFLGKYSRCRRLHPPTPPVAALARSGGESPRAELVA
jgi:hypothetical protein